MSDRSIVVNIIGQADKFRAALKQGEREADGFGKKLKGKMKLAGAAAGAAIAAGIGAALKSGVDFTMERKDAGRKLMASMGLSPEEAARAAEATSAAYVNNFGDSMGDLNNTLAAIWGNMPGYREANPDFLRGMIEDVHTVADVFDMETNRIVDLTSRLMNAGLAKNMDEATDLLTRTFQLVAPNMREAIGDAIDEYAPFARAIGIEGPQLMAKFVDAAEKGEYGIDKFGDAIKEFGIRSTDGSKASVAAFERIRLDADKMAATFVKGGPEASRALDKVIEGLMKIKDPAERAQHAVALFGTPVEDLALTDLPAFLKSLKSTSEGLGEFKGSTEEAGDAIYNTFQARLDGFKRKSLVAFAEFMEARVIPLLKDWAAWLRVNVGPEIDKAKERLREMLQGARKWFDENEDSVREWGKALKAAFRGVYETWKKTMKFALDYMGAWADSPQAKLLFKTLDALAWAINAANTGMDRLERRGGPLGGVLKGLVPGLNLLPGRAVGGPVRAGGAYMVGERGPELFVPSASGSIRQEGARGGPVQVVLTVAGNGDVADLIRKIVRVEGAGSLGLAAAR